MTWARTLRRHRVFLLTGLACLAGLIVGVGPAVAAGSPPGSVPSVASPTHPNQSLWYSSPNPTFTWTAATAGTYPIAGYSFVLDQNPTTLPGTSSASNSFSSQVPYSVGSGPAEDRVADLSGNGIEDIIVENSSSNTVSVLMGNGDGTFKPAVNYATGTDPWSMDIGDLTGNGKLDIVTCNNAANTVSVLMGNGDGTFQPAVNYSTGTGSAPECVRLGDVNGDGKLDIVTANSGPNNISVLVNNGNGTFGAPTTFSTATHPTSIALGDVNGDGKLDIITANYSSNNVSVLMGNGNGTFQSAVNYACGTQPETVVVADLNGDGKPDIATVNYVGTASVLLNQGNGTFATHVDYTTGAGPYDIGVADLNHDGIPDLVTTNHVANTVSILYGNGNGTFQSKVDLATGTGPFWVALGEFTSSGYGDLAVTNETNGTVSVLLGSGYFRPASSPLTASFAGKADGVWYFHVRTVDNQGQGGTNATTFAVHIDTTPPVSSESGADAAWHKNPATVTFTSVDATSGVAFTQYSVDGGAWTTGSAVTIPAPTNGSNDGTHTVQYRSTDNAGNVETAKSCTVKIDATPPTTTESGADSAWHNTPITVSLAASDASSGVAGTQYSVDGGAWTSGTSVLIPAPSNGSNDGSHTVQYRSTDNAGNVETTKSCTVKIDTTPPVTTASGLAASAGSAWTDVSPQSVSLSASDVQSGVATTYYTVDSGAQQTYSGPFTVAGSGTHTITYWSTDVAGNAEPSHTGYVNIDTTAPVTTASGLAATGTSNWHNGLASFTLAASDSQSGVATTNYTIDGGPTKLYTGGPVLVSGDASHIVTYWSTDVAGNAEPSHTGYVNIDTMAPVTTASGLASSAGSAWTDVSPQSVSLSASDVQSGVAATYYTVDSGAQQTYSGPFTVAGSGTHTITYWSTDVAGNSEPSHTGYVNIDTTPPVTTASGLAASAGSAWTDVSPQSVSLSASDVQSGVAATYYTVDSGAQQTYSGPFTVAGSGTHTITYWSTDVAGNSEPSHTGYVNIDTTPPVTTASGLASSAGSAWTDVSPQSVSLSASDVQSGVAATYYTVDSGAQQTYSGALSISTAGLHTVTYWSVDVAGNVEQTNTGYVGIDTTPPTVTDNSDEAWHNTDVTVTLSPSDPGGSGIAKTQYRLEGSDTWLDTAANQFVVPASADGSNDGAHIFQYRAIDLAGNDSATESCTVKIDATAPTTVESGADGAWHNSAVTVNFSATDTQSGVASTQYSIDGGAWTSGTSVTIAALADGSNDGTHTIQYDSTDNAGNTEATKSCTVMIDTTPPKTTESGADLAWHATPVTVSFTATDAGCGVAATYYQVDDGAWTEGTSVTIPAPSDGSNDGIHAIDYYSVDNLGNGEASHDCQVMIETQPPVTVDNAGTSWHAVPFTLQLSSSDLSGNATTTQYSIGDDTHWQTGNSLPFTSAWKRGGGSGEVTVYYRSINGAGLVESEKSCVVMIDTSRPRTTDDAPLGPQASDVTVHLTGHDTFSGIGQTWYQVDGGSWVEGNTVVVAAPSNHANDGVHTIRYYSIDNAGNIEAGYRVCSVDIVTK